MAASRLQVELEQLRDELTTIAAESETARLERMERRNAAIARYRAIGDSVKRNTRQITPFVLLAAVGLGVLVGRQLSRK